MPVQSGNFGAHPIGGRLAGSKERSPWSGFHKGRNALLSGWSAEGVNPLPEPWAEAMKAGEI
jgi:hypothetical protein